MFRDPFRFVLRANSMQIPAEFATEANAIFDAFELEGHTTSLRIS
jgi:hypothetical protein